MSGCLLKIVTKASINAFMIETHMKFLFSPFIVDGKFGAMMQVHIQNDGPVTIPLESPANLQVHVSLFVKI